MSWYDALKYNLIIFFSEGLNYSPFNAGAYSCGIGLLGGVATYQLLTVGVFSTVSILLLGAAFAYFCWEIRQAYSDWRAACGNVKKREQIAFVWSAWPSFLIGLIGGPVMMFVHSLLGLGVVVKVAVMAIPTISLLLFCGWMGSMTARHIISGGQIRWGGIN
jgi:hypothetical protein